MIELQQVCKSYGLNNQTNILNNVNLLIRRNEHVAIVGRSGSGKTTLLNILGGLTTIDSGIYLFDNIPLKLSNINQSSEFRRKKVGFVVQNYALLYDRTVYENVSLALDHALMSRDAKSKIIKSTLDELDIEQHMKKRPAELSGGECQRVAIARALVNDPEIILADEPTGALDSKTEDTILNYIFTLRKTVIIATHNPDVAAKCQRTIQIIDGTIE